MRGGTGTSEAVDVSGPPVAGFEAHPARGRFNSAFFWAMGGYIDWHMRSHKSAAFADLPMTVVELGAGVGANVGHLPPGGRLIAVEPNPYMHGGCGVPPVATASDSRSAVSSAKRSTSRTPAWTP